MSFLKTVALCLAAQDREEVAAAIQRAKRPRRATKPKPAKSQTVFNGPRKTKTKDGPKTVKFNGPHKTDRGRASEAATLTLHTTAKLKTLIPKIGTATENMDPQAITTWAGFFADYGPQVLAALLVDLKVLPYSKFTEATNFFSHRVKH
jgi:hypothetical protein